MSAKPETRLGRYELLEELGRGAMGIVYKARDPQIDRLVAIKTICNLGQDLEEEHTYRTRFFLEARAAGRLSHRGIVQVFDVAEDADTRNPYIVMEYVAGLPLNRMFVPGVIWPLERALRLTQDLAEALAYAHAQGVIHRDIKPSNIIVGEEDHARITDFGVAKLDYGNGTLGGQIIGTPGYMAPEQLENSSSVDGRSDLFSLGVILYSMLSGHRPFQGNSPNTIGFRTRHHNPISVTAFKPELSPEIDYVFARALAKDPAERYQTGADMALDLQDLRNGNVPRSRVGLAVPGPVVAEDVAKEAHQESYQSIVSAANMAALCEPDAASVSRVSRPKATTGSFVWGVGQKAPVWSAVVIALGLSFLGVRTFFAPPALASRNVNTIPKPVSTHNSASRPNLADFKAPIRKASPPTGGVLRTATMEKNWSQETRQQQASSSVQLEIQHPFDQGQISVWIDDRPAYTDSLHGEMRNHLVVFHHVRGKQFNTLKLSPGEHRLRVRVKSAADGYDQEESILGGFENDVARTLQIKCDKRHKKLSLIWASL